MRPLITARPTSRTGSLPRARWGIEVYFEKCRRRDLARRDGFAQGFRARARLRADRPIQRAKGQADGPNLLPVTLREVLRMSLMSIGVEL
jgi:hypothetical protein